LYNTSKGLPASDNFTSDVWKIYINETANPASDLSSNKPYKFIPVANIKKIELTTINNTTALQDGQAILKGDKIYMNITTESFIKPRNAILYAIAVNASNYSDVMGKVQLSENESSRGNYTGVIDANKVGEWIILINNSVNDCINQSVKFNVTDLKVEIASGFIKGQTQQFFVAFNTTDKNGNNLAVNRTYNFTVTLGDSRPHDKFVYNYQDNNITLTNNNRTAILTLYAGNDTVGNITLLNLTVSRRTLQRVTQ